MPRERITQETFTPTDNPNVVDLVPENHLHVGFNRHGEWVQVGVELSIADLESKLESLRREAESTVGVENPDHFTGIVWSTVLNRADLNNLVRQTRKARDAAYGADA